MKSSLILFTALFIAAAGCSWGGGASSGAPGATDRPIPPPGSTLTCSTSSANVFTVYSRPYGTAACDWGAAYAVYADTVEAASSCAAVRGVPGPVYAYPGVPTYPPVRCVTRGAGLYEGRSYPQHHTADLALACVQAQNPALFGLSSCPGF